MKAADVYQLEVVPLSRWRRWRNIAVLTALSAIAPGGTGEPTVSYLRVVERATGRVIYRHRTNDGYMRESLEADLQEMSAEEFLRTWG